MSPKLQGGSPPPSADQPTTAASPSESDSHPAEQLETSDVPEKPTHDADLAALPMANDGSQQGSVPREGLVLMWLQLCAGVVDRFCTVAATWQLFRDQPPDGISESSMILAQAARQLFMRAKNIKSSLKNEQPFFADSEKHVQRLNELFKTFSKLGDPVAPFDPQAGRTEFNRALILTLEKLLEHSMKRYLLMQKGTFIKQGERLPSGLSPAAAAEVAAVIAELTTSSKNQVDHPDKSELKEDHDSGYKALGLTREEAFTLLSNHVYEVHRLFRKALQEVIVQPDFYRYLITKHLILPCTFKKFRDQIEDRLEDPSVNVGFVAYAIRDKKMKAHPAVLQALAFIQKNNAINPRQIQKSQLTAGAVDGTANDSEPTSPAQPNVTPSRLERDALIQTIGNIHGWLGMLLRDTPAEPGRMHDAIMHLKNAVYLRRKLGRDDIRLATALFNLGETLMVAKSSIDEGPKLCQEGIEMRKRIVTRCTQNSQRLRVAARSQSASAPPATTFGVNSERRSDDDPDIIYEHFLLAQGYANLLTKSRGDNPSASNACRAANESFQAYDCARRLVPNDAEDVRVASIMHTHGVRLEEFESMRPNTLATHPTAQSTSITVQSEGVTIQKKALQSLRRLCGNCRIPNIDFLAAAANASSLSDFAGRNRYDTIFRNLTRQYLNSLWTPNVGIFSSNDRTRFFESLVSKNVAIVVATCKELTEMSDIKFDLDLILPPRPVDKVAKPRRQLPDRTAFLQRALLAASFDDPDADMRLSQQDAPGAKRFGASLIDPLLHCQYEAVLESLQEFVESPRLHWRRRQQAELAQLPLWFAKRRPIQQDFKPYEALQSLSAQAQDLQAIVSLIDHSNHQRSPAAASTGTNEESRAADAPPSPASTLPAPSELSVDKEQPHHHRIGAQPNNENLVVGTRNLCEYLTHTGVALCIAGFESIGMRMFDTAVTMLRRVRKETPPSTILAWALTKQSICAARLGQIQRALRLAQEAHAELVATLRDDANVTDIVLAADNVSHLTQAFSAIASPNEPMAHTWFHELKELSINCATADNLKPLVPAATGALSAATPANALATSTTTKGNICEQKMFSLVDGSVTAYKKTDPPNDVFIRYTVPRTLKLKANKLLHHTSLASRHPNVLMPLIAVKHRDGSTDIDMEYADGGTLNAFIPRFEATHRVAVAMSVARQVLHSLAYFDIVHGLHHHNLRPRYIYTRLDGCVKTDVYDMFDAATINNNKAHFLDSPYTAPECRTSTAAFLQGNGKADVWAVGVLIVAIMEGRTLDLPFKATREGDPNPPPPPTTDEVIACRAECNNLDKMVDRIPDDALRYLARCCLETSAAKRPSPCKALAMTYVLGGVTSACEEATIPIAKQLAPGLPNPWALDPSKKPFEPPKCNPSDQNSGPALKKALANIAEISQKTDEVSEVLKAELAQWKELRDNTIRRPTTDKAMREVIRSRETTAWECLKVAEQKVRMLRQQVGGQNMAPAASTPSTPSSADNLAESPESKDSHVTEVRSGF